LGLDELEHAREMRMQLGFLEHAVDDRTGTRDVMGIKLGIIEAVGKALGSIVIRSAGWRSAGWLGKG
jgi:hypothetical protein